MADDAETPTASPFETTQRDAKRAQWALNALVIFSAIAGSFFFVYVLRTIDPFGPKDAANVEVPTSAAAARYGVLTGKDEATGLDVLLRDIDEAPGYRDQLSETMRRELGIAGNGRMYLLVIRNDGAAALTVAAEALQVTDKSGGQWQVSWLEQAAEKVTAGPTGRMRITQSEHKFELAKGAERQLYVFIADAPPPAEEFAVGSLRLASGLEVPLSRTEIRATVQ